MTDYFLTKLDVLSSFDRIPVCVAYDVDGTRLDEVPTTQTEFHHAKPVYEVLPGWGEDISGVRDFVDLPANCRAYVRFLEEQAGCQVSAIGVGPDRDATLVLKDLLP
jgi:adenylosuccinate synthase